MSQPEANGSPESAPESPPESAPESSSTTASAAEAADQSAPRALRVGALLAVLFFLASIAWDLAASEVAERTLPWRLGAVVVIAALGVASYWKPAHSAILGAAIAAVGAAAVGAVVAHLPAGLSYGTGSLVLVATVIGFVALDGKAALLASGCAGVAGFVSLWLGRASTDAMFVVGFFYVPALAGAVLFAHTTRLRIERNQVLRRELSALREDLRRFGHTDELTGVYDEKQLQQLGRRELALARRRKRSLSALKIGIAHLGDINERYGVEAGNETLRAVASMCQATLRETDLLARLHKGDEFAAVLPEADEAGAATLCTRLQKSLARASVLANGKLLEVNVTVGIATLAEGDKSIDDLLKRADDDLRAHKNGTNGTSASA